MRKHPAGPDDLPLPGPGRSGRPHAIRKGRGRATGEVFHRLSSDDRLLPEGRGRRAGALRRPAQQASHGPAWLPVPSTEHVTRSLGPTDLTTVAS